MKIILASIALPFLTLIIEILKINYIVAKSVLLKVLAVGIKVANLANEDGDWN